MTTTRRFRWEPGEPLDPANYLQWLSSHGDELPPGASVFARPPSHFDYNAYRRGNEVLEPGTPLCPKDLLLHRLTWSGHGNDLELRLMFPGYNPKEIGTFDLTLTYRNVRRLQLEHRAGAPTRQPIQLGGLMADEIAPGEPGVVHYLDFECGSIIVAGDDFTGTWR